MSHIDSVAKLRDIYVPAKGRAAEKVIYQLERHSRRILELSPFLIIGTRGSDGLGDVSPRGDAPGFVQALDDKTLLIPDRPGNNRLDTLSNIIHDPAVSLIFLVPGVDEVFRVNGYAEIRDDDDLRERFAVNGKLPATVLVVKIKEAFLHCAKAIMRAGLWDGTRQIDRKMLPTIGQMINDQINGDFPVESQEKTVEQYKAQLY